MKQNIGELCLINDSGIQRYGIFLGEEDGLLSLFIFEKLDWYYRFYEKEKTYINKLPPWQGKEFLSEHPLHSSLIKVLYDRKRKNFLKFYNERS